MFDPSVSIAIAFHSGRGHTARLAEAVRDGAASVENSTAKLIALPDRQHHSHIGPNGSNAVAKAGTPLIGFPTVTDEEWALLDQANAIIFGSPTYMGDVSAVFRLFAEQSSPRMQAGAWRNKLAAGFVNSGAMSGDKVHTLQTLAMFAAQHGMTWVNLGLLAGWNASTGSEFDLNRLGFFLGAGAQSNVDEPPERVHTSDLATARHLGRRVAQQARAMAVGGAYVLSEPGA
ncbi:MAG: flavodoxin family protein [Chloroflexota bacterium]|nr:flavodoxin family protein [Chloroflexota bacterium]